MKAALVVFGLVSVAHAEVDQTVTTFATALQGQRASEATATLAQKIEIALPMCPKATRDTVAACLIKLEPSSTKSHFGTGGGVIILREGVAIGATVKDRMITKLGYVDADRGDTTPTVFRFADLVAQKLVVDAKLVGSVAIKACIDEKGKLASSRVVLASGSPELDAAAIKVVHDFAFSPVELGGKKSAVCEVIRFDRGTTPDIDIERPTNVAVAALKRVKGSANVVPAARIKDRVSGSWKVCLDAKGVYKASTMLKSTGAPAFDAQIAKAVKSWAFEPYLVNGTAVPVCTVATFVYQGK